MASKFSPDLLQAPIPGMSLTKAPREMPFENPPELFKIEDVIEHYVDRIADPDVEDPLLLMLDEGVGIDLIADFITTSGTRNSIHSLDLGFLVNPVVRELIKYIADSANVEYVDSYAEREKRKKIPYREMRTVIKEVFQTNPNIADPQDPEVAKVVPKGLMARAPEMKPMLDAMPTDTPKENL
tara:strand:- start:2808 stop:3356 length:549 start_codon:yes stop_codon:yes gene_type:complete